MNAECERYSQIDARFSDLHGEVSDEEFAFMSAHENTCKLHSHKTLTDADLANDPRTKPLVDRLAARLHKELAELDKKRPAHEVLLDKLEDCVENLEKPSWSKVSGASAHVKILCDILREMVIPAKHWEDIVLYVHLLRRRCRKWEEANNSHSHEGDALDSLIQRLLTDGKPAA